MQTQTTTISALLLAGCLAAIPASHAEIFIINTQTMEPEQVDTATSRSLSDVQANRAVLLQYYHYDERRNAALLHQRSIQELSYRVQQFTQTGADEPTLAALNNQIRQLQGDTQKALVFLSPFELPEMKQLYAVEKDNADKLAQLQRQAETIRTIAPVPASSATE